jgi:signal transduction histidine kinase/CheY-like chemotaxis protein
VPTIAPPLPTTSEAALDAICLRQSYAALPARGVFTSIQAAGTAWVIAISSDIPAGRLWAWVVAAWVLGVVRIALGRWILSRPRSDEEIRGFLPAFTVSMVLPAINWGVLIFVTGLSTSTLVVAVILLAIGGMMAAGAHSTALTPKVMLSSIVLSFSPICVHMALSGDPVLRAILVTLSGYIFTAIASMRTNNREARASMALRFENQDLVERLVVEKEHALQADREKTRFMAAASHDVRQPLHAMGLFVDTLKEQPLAPPARKLLSSIELAHASLISLHEGLLDVSVLDAGGVVARPRVVPVRELLHALETEATPRARERGLELKVRGVDENLLTDPDLLLRVLRNLVGNALAYTPKGRVLVAVRKRGPRALVQVWDTGIGIPEDQLGLIFNELHQVANQARDRTKGMGLGLSIVERLGKALGFEVKVRSVLGKGSVFSFEVPLAVGDGAGAAWKPEAPRPETEPGMPQKRAPEGSVALLVDDDGLARSALASMLGHWGYEVIAAQSAEDAQQYLVDLDRLDLVVSDFWLPGRSGLEFLSSVGTSHPKLRRVMISGDTAPQTEVSARSAGVTFIRKPVRAAQLHAALELP